MATLNQGKWTGEFLLSEGNGDISREQVTIAAASPAMVPGTVLGKITASGKYAPYNNANVDGTQTAAGILYAACPDSASDQKAVMIARYAEVAQVELTGYDVAAGVELAAIGIIVR
jgi:hypothetical protein